jgi:hypothetical protein
VLFDRVCAENGIRHLLAAPRSPTTTGKVERWYKTIRAEFLRDHDYKHATMAGLQQALDAWVDHYNTERPHQALGMRPAIERFQLAARPGVETVVEPSAVPAAPLVAVVEPSPQIVRLRGVQRWVDQHGLISLGGFRYRVPIVLAGSRSRRWRPIVWCGSSTARFWSPNTSNAAPALSHRPPQPHARRLGRGAAAGAWPSPPSWFGR